MVCLELQREGTSHFFTSGSEITTRSKWDFLGVRTHYGARRVNVSVQKSDAECLWGLYLSMDLQDMRGIMSSAHTLWAKTFE